MERTNLISWSSLWKELDAQGDPAPIHAQLVAAYTEPHRHYHTLGHLAECLAEFDAVRFLAQEAATIETALWFHDAVYDPHAPDNEARSAELAAICLTAAAVPAAFIATVRQHILATWHQSVERSGDTALLTDIDLAILGQPPARFWHYESDIRREYARVPPALYAEKRGEILAGFLSRPSLFATEIFRKKYEQPARANLFESLRHLQGSHQS